MKPVKTEHSNHNVAPPSGVSDGSIGDLPCQFVKDEIAAGIECDLVRSVWELSDEERAAIANGANVELEVAWLGMFPPVALNVTEERSVDG